MKFCQAKIIFCLAISALVVISFVFSLQLYLKSSQRLSEPIFIQIKDMTIKAEVATSPQAHYKGLSGRRDLCSDCGLLFVFPDNQIRSFVMRDMNFPLDIIFIEKGVIKNISASANQNDPNTIYFSQGTADQVLEINAGLSTSYSLVPGDEIKIKNYEN